MQKRLVWFLAVLLLLSIAPALAEEGSWYALSEDEEVLAVTLPANESTGYRWLYRIENPDALVCKSAEYVAAQTETALLGAPGLWQATFSAGGGAGQVLLMLEYMSPVGEIAQGYQMDLWMVENGQMEIRNVEEYWYFVDADEKALIVRLDANPTTGYQWEALIPDNGGLELVTDQYVPDAQDESMVGAGGKWMASFRILPGFSGETDLALRYHRSWEEEAIQTRVLRIVVTPEGIIGSVTQEQPVQ